jgi:hypothetical protein
MVVGLFTLKLHNVGNSNFVMNIARGMIRLLMVYTLNIQSA